LNCSTIADKVISGKLEIVLNQFAPTSTGFYLYYPQRSQVQPKLLRFQHVAPFDRIPEPASSGKERKCVWAFTTSGMHWRRRKQRLGIGAGTASAADQIEFDGQRGILAVSEDVVIHDPKGSN
jgi:hypothetical protein